MVCEYKLVREEESVYMMMENEVISMEDEARELNEEYEVTAPENNSVVVLDGVIYQGA